MVTARFLILLVGAVALCEASPARMFFNSGRGRSVDSVAEVDCSDREAVKLAAKTNANFRCIYPERKARQSLSSNDVNNPRHVFPAGLQSASLIKEDPTECGPGQMFVSEIGLCLDAFKPKHTAPLESDSLVKEDLIDEISSFSSSHVATDCKPGEIYNSELSLCMTANKKKKGGAKLPTLNLVKEPESVGPLELVAFSSSINSANDCKPGEMYVSEIGACVEINPNPLKSASLIRERSADSAPFDRPQTAKDCGPNEVYVSEVGICLPHTPPKDKRPLVSDSLVKDEEPSRPVPDTAGSCKEDELYVPEIGICLPIGKPSNKKPSPPSSASLVKEPEKLEIQAFETAQSASDCPAGTHFVPEIGLCLD